MKDIPMFTTESGVASLALREIPYTGTAYIRLQATQSPETLLEECVGFCRACGAARFYATGHPALARYPLHTAVVRMQCSRNSLPMTDAALFPVLPETLEQWRGIYNERMAGVPGAAYMSRMDAEAMLADGSCYFIHRAGQPLGIGKAKGDRIDAVISLSPGGGREVTLALASVLTEDTVCLEVATANTKAVRLYEGLGFAAVQELVRWYQVDE